MNEQNSTEQEKHSRNLDGKTGIATLINDERGDIKCFNKGCSALFGYSRKEMKAQSVKSLVHPDDIERVMKFHERCILNMDISPKYEFRGINKEGHTVYLEAITSRRGKRACSYLWDITEHKRIEKELAESEKKYRSLVENLNVGVYRVTPGTEGSFIDINRAFASILGYESKEEVMRLKVSDIYYNPADRKKFNDKILAEGLVRDEELHLKKKDGTSITVSDTGVAVYSNGELMYFDGILEDISEQKKTEMDLKIKGSAISSSINAIAIADLEGVLTYVNPSFLEMWGCTDEKEILGRPAIELWQNEKQASELLKALVETGGWIGELVGKRKDGTISAVVSQSLNIDEILDAALDRLLKLLGLDVGGIYLADPVFQKLDLVIHQGVSEEFAIEMGSIQVDKKTLEAVTARGRLRKFILSTKAVFKNQKELRRILRAMKKEELDLDSCVLTLLQAKENILGLMILGSRESRQFSEAELELLASVGQQIAVAIENSRLYRASQEELEMRKKTEEALRESEEKFRNLIEDARDTIITLDLEGNMTSVNKVITEYGFKRDEVLGKNMLSFASEKYWPSMLGDLTRVAQGNPVEGEIELTTPRGVKIAEYRTNPIRKGGEVVGLQTILRDITERKIAEEKLREYSETLESMVEDRTRELQKAQEELIRKEKLATLGQLAGSVGHEIRNPLGIIGSSAYFLKMRIKDPDEKVRKHLDIIDKNVQQANKIVTDLLDFSRTRELFQVESSINDIIQGALANIEIPENILVKVQLDEKAVKAPVDPDQIQQVFLNLITNALEAMPEGGDLDITTKVKDDFIHIVCKDTGRGISKEDLEKIFDPLFTTKTKGIGLGLTIVKSIVERHGGTIEVESKMGIGTVFTITLPLQKLEKRE